MSDKDTQLLAEAYVNQVLLEKALTPAQIAKNAQPAGSSGKKSGELPKNKTEDKETLKTLEEVPYTDQHADNFNQDGVDTKVEDRYVVKEDGGIQDVGGPNDGAEEYGNIGSAVDKLESLEGAVERLSGLIPRNGFMDANEDFLAKLDQAHALVVELVEVVENLNI